MTTAATIYKYWALRSKCDAGRSLTLTEAADMAKIKRNHMSDSGHTYDVGDSKVTGFVRCDKGYANQTEFGELALDGVVGHGGPMLSEGTLVELHLETNHASYRFIARVSWQCEGDDNQLVTGYRFEGAALSLRYGPVGRAPSMCAFSRLAA